MKKKKIFIFQQYNYSPLLEISLEILIRELNAKNDVYLFLLGHNFEGEIDMCWPRKKEKYKRFFKFLPEIIGINLIENKFPNFKKIKYIIKPDIKIINVKTKNFNNLEELKKITYQNFDVGYATLSSFISKYKNPFPNIKKNKQELKKNLLNGISLYEYVDFLLKENKPDSTYIYNGRPLHTRSILRACQKNKIKSLIYERGKTDKTFSLWSTDSLDKNKFVKYILTEWKNYKYKNNIKKIFNAWFLSRRKETRKNISNQETPIFTKGQDINFTKPKDKRVVTFFSSSMDEFEATGDTFVYYFNDQINSIESLIKEVNKFDNTILVIKIHPNVQNKSKNEKKIWDDLSTKYCNHKNVQIYSYDSKVRTYDVLDKSDIVFSCGTTVGLEAMFYGKPSVLLSSCMTDYIKSYYIAKSSKEIFKILNLKKFKKINFKDFYSWIYFKTYLGQIKFKYFKYINLDQKNIEPYSGYFLNKNLHENRKKLLNKLYFKLLNIY